MDTDSYKLNIMPRAAIDLDNIYGYISQESSAPAAAQKLIYSEPAKQMLRRFSIVYVTPP
jgi:hypothetical protein